MNFGDVVVLISAAHHLDEIGNYMPEETKREVFADVRSISQTEALRAGQIGFLPSLKMLLRRCDYQEEGVVEVYGKRHTVYRTYCAGDIMELYLEKKMGAI